MKAFIPWAFSITLATALGYLYVAKEREVTALAAEVRNLQGALQQVTADANEKIAAAHSQTKQAKESAKAELEQLENIAQQRIDAANLKEVQVMVSFRKALLSSGQVAIIRSTSGQSIAITAVISRPSSNQSISREMALDPNQMVEIGQREGWAFIPGDVIKIEQPHHKSLSFAVP